MLHSTWILGPGLTRVETSSSRGHAGSTRKLKWSRSGAGASGGAHASWQGTIDELAKAPSARLFPFVKVQPPRLQWLHGP